MITKIYPYSKPWAAKQVEHDPGECPYCKVAVEVADNPGTVQVFFLQSGENERRRVTVVEENGSITAECREVTRGEMIDEIHRPSKRIQVPDLAQAHCREPPAPRGGLGGAESPSLLIGSLRRGKR